MVHALAKCLQYRNLPPRGRNANQSIGAVRTMTSREIAELTGSAANGHAFSSTRFNFVNLRGNPVCIPSTPPKAKKPKADPSRGKKHLGWRVVGFRLGVVEAAREAHKDGDGPFDADAWMSRHKPANVRTKPYSLPCSAAECARLAVAAGWVGVQIVEVIE